MFCFFNLSQGYLIRAEETWHKAVLSLSYHGYCHIQLLITCSSSTLPDGVESPTLLMLGLVSHLLCCFLSWTELISSSALMLASWYLPYTTSMEEWWRRLSSIKWDIPVYLMGHMFICNYRGMTWNSKFWRPCLLTGKAIAPPNSMDVVFFFPFFFHKALLFCCFTSALSSDPLHTHAVSYLY